MCLFGVSRFLQLVVKNSIKTNVRVFLQIAKTLYSVGGIFLRVALKQLNLLKLN